MVKPNWLHEAALNNDIAQIEAKSLAKSYELDINFNDRLQ